MNVITIPRMRKIPSTRAEQEDAAAISGLVLHTDLTIDSQIILTEAIEDLAIINIILGRTPQSRTGLTTTALALTPAPVAPATGDTHAEILLHPEAAADPVATEETPTATESTTSTPTQKNMRMRISVMI